MSEFAISVPEVVGLPIVGSTQQFPVRRVYCIGRNYAAHAIEMGHDPNREPPFFFQKNPNNLDPSGEFPYPPKSSDVHHEAELAVMRKVAEWPRAVEAAAKAHEPHRIAFYLYDLASDFHALWNRGNDEPSIRFLQDDDKLSTIARLLLIRAVSVVISNGLGILGVIPLREMR